MQFTLLGENLKNWKCFIMWRFCVFTVFILIIPCQSQSQSENNKIRVIESKLRRCCSTEFGLRNGKCENEPESEAGKENQKLLYNVTLPMQLFGSDLKFETDETVQLRLLTPSLPICNKGWDFLSIPYLGPDTNYTQTTNANILPRFDMNGSLIYNNHTYDPEQYCINGVDIQKVEVVLCNPECNSERVCLRKCCKSGFHLEAGKNRMNCIPSNGKQWNPKIHDDERNLVKHFEYAHPSLGWCSSGLAYFMYEKDYPGNKKTDFRILKDGTVLVKSRHWKPLPKESFCLEGVNPDVKDSDNQHFQETAIFHCLSESEAHNDPEAVGLAHSIIKLYLTLAVISSFFVLLTIIVYGLLWETQNIHGWTLLSFFTSLFFLYTLLSAMYILGLYFKETTDVFSISLCWGVGIGLHFSYLSTFCWMSILNYDLWTKFRNLRRSNNKTKIKRFVMYSLFGVGVPCLIIAVAITLDEISKTDERIPEALTPEYGVDRCFLSNRKPSLVFLYGPISVLLCLNFIFFLLTMRAMYQIKKIASLAVSKSNSRRQSVNLFAKLFVVMGVTWIFEVITWSTHPTTIPWWYIGLDVINFCHGIFIFIIFICKRSTILSLEQKYPSFKKVTSLFSRCTSAMKSSCCETRALERSHTIESTMGEMEERRKSNETVMTTIGVIS